MSLDLLSQPITAAEKEEFCVEMMKRLDFQRRNEQFCDAKLEVGSGDDQARLKAHRIVLCAASPFFYNALNSDMKEKKEGVIRLEETSKAVMEEVLEYLYTGHVDINEENAFDLLQIADFLIVPSLKELSGKFISQTLSSSNCINAYYAAERYQFPELQTSARDFALANFMDVTQYDEFLNLSVTQVEGWISSDDIIVKGEEEVFQVIVKWMERDEGRKHQSFYELFHHVRLVYVSRNYVFNGILSHPLVKDSDTCTELVLDALKELSYGTEECYFAQPPRSCLKTHEDAIVACGMATKKTLCLIPSEKKWYKLAGVTKVLSTVQRIGSAMATCHGKVYLAGVNGDGEGALERYDPSGNSWAPVKPFVGTSTTFNTPAIVSFQGFLYVVGGKIDAQETNRVHRYNPEMNLWQEVAPMSITRSGLCAVADRNSLYAIGGHSGGETLDLVESFDPERSCWKRIASTLEKKSLACGAVIRGKVFIFGGFCMYRDLTSHSNITEIYDPSTNMWNRIERTGAPQLISSAVSFKGKVFVIGSSLEQGIPCNFSLQAYDIDRDEWESCLNISNSNKVCTVAALRIPRDILDKCEVVPQE